LAKKKPRERVKKGFDTLLEWVKTQNPKDLAELALMGGLAYLGYERFKDWKGALVGPISLKLALTPGGMGVPVSQVAGLSGLLLLGAAVSGGAGIPPQEGGGEGFWEKQTELHCEKGYVLDWNIRDGWYCKPMRQPT